MRDLSFLIVQGIICLSVCLRQISLHLLFRAVNLFGMMSTNYIHRVCHTHRAWGGSSLIWHFIDDLQSRVGDNWNWKWNALHVSHFARKSSRKIHIMAKRGTCRQLGTGQTGRYPAMALLSFTLFFLHFSISQFRFFFCFFFCHLRQLMLWQIEAQSRKVLPALIMSVSEMILATFTLALLLLLLLMLQCQC